MSLRFFSLPCSLFHRLLLAGLCTLPLASGACSDDSSGDETAVADYSVEVTSLNGTGSGETIALRCDATLAAQVTISASDPTVPFLIKPAYACGTSVRCGYVHIEALDADDAVLASVDTATQAGVLTLPSADIVPARIRAILLSGVDREPIENPNGEEPSTTVEPTFALPTASCETEGVGGSPGAGGAAQGGAPSGGAPQGGAPSGGGEGGSAAAAGASGAAQGGGAGASGAAQGGGAGASGAAQGDSGAAGVP